IIQLLHDDPKTFIVRAHKLGSQQMYQSHMSYCGQAVGKNTKMPKLIGGHQENNPALKKFEAIRSPRSISLRLGTCCLSIRCHLLALLLPLRLVKVTVPAQNSSLEPEETFFQDLGTLFKISRGTIEILMIETGDKWEPAKPLLCMLNTSPSSVGQSPSSCVSLAASAILSCLASQNKLCSCFLEGVHSFLCPSADWLASCCISAPFSHQQVPGFKEQEESGSVNGEVQENASKADIMVYLEEADSGIFISDAISINWHNHVLDTKMPRPMGSEVAVMLPLDLSLQAQVCRLTYAHAILQVSTIRHACPMLMTLSTFCIQGGR
ncbi:60S acidic ribosomal protein P0, partial [Galemys pyrenaicus]